MRPLHLSLLAVLAIGCNLEDPIVPPGSGGAAGTSTQGTAGTPPATGGSGDTPMAGTGPSTAGSNAMTGGSGGAATTEGGAATVGGSTTAGSGPMGGTTTGGTTTGGTTTAGGSGGGVAVDLKDVVKVVDGLHLDDACGNISSDTCIHQKTNPYELFKEVTIGGTPGTSYDVKLRFRGVMETATISGGTEPAEFANDKVTVDGSTWRSKPMSVDGTVADPTYQPWYLQVSSPAHTFYLNDQNRTAHTVIKVDMEYTVQMDAGAKIKIDWKDGNDHEIINKANDTFADLGDMGKSVNRGQFLHVTVTSIAIHK